jgi:hypothetical protein
VRLLPALAQGGELVIGNFSDCNPSRTYMELLGDWYLHHRSDEDLRLLAHQAGVPGSHVRIGCERLKVNLFLHIAAG